MSPALQLMAFTVPAGPEAILVVAGVGLLVLVVAAAVYLGVKAANRKSEDDHPP